MGPHFRILSILVHVAVLTLVTVLGATRSGPKMNEVINDASEITWAHAVNSWDALEKALSGPVDFLEADISLGSVKGNEGYLPIPIMAHPPDTTSDISLDTWLSTVAARRPDKGIKLDFKSVDVLEPSLVLLKKYSSKLNGSLWLGADILSGPVHRKAVPIISDYFLEISTRYFPNATLSLGWATHWIKSFPVNTWVYEWKHVRKMADTVRCWYDNRMYPAITFSVRAMFASRSIKQLQWLLENIPRSSLVVWSAAGDQVNSEDFLRIQKSFPAAKLFLAFSRSLFKPSSQLKTDYISQKTYIKDDSKWVSVTCNKDNICETFTYTHGNFILFGRPTNSVVFQRTLIPLDINCNFTLTGKVKFFPGEEKILPFRNPSYWEHKLKLILFSVDKLPKYAVSHSKKKRIFKVRDPDVLWSAVNSSVLFTFEHQYFQDNTACRMFKLHINSNLFFDAWAIPCDATFGESTEEEISKNSISEISLKEDFDMEGGMLMIGFHSYGEEFVLIYDLTAIENGEEEAVLDFPELKMAFTSLGFIMKAELALVWQLLLTVFQLWIYSSLWSP